ncbi:MAG: hypothetical protein ACOY0T_15420 [Myxococcota bacterium]
MAHTQRPARSAFADRLSAFDEAPTFGAGESVLVPTPRSLRAALESIEASPLVYAAGVVEQPARSESVVRWPNGERGGVPNALLIPLGKASQAEPSSVILASGGKGAGLALALVVRGGEPESPLVRVLEGAQAASEEPEPAQRVAANTFRVLRADGEVGAPYACRRAGRVERLLLLRRSTELVLGFAFAGQVDVIDAAHCRALPLRPNVKPGDRVNVPLASVFVRANVEQVEAELGRIEVLADFAGQRRALAFGFGSVATQLPPP